MKTLKMLLLFAMLVFAGESLAQCPMQPQVMGGGPPRCWGDPIPSAQYQQYNNGVAQYGQYGTYNGQQMLIPQGLGVGDSFVRNVGGQPMRCTIADRAATALMDGAIGAAIGALVNRNDRRRGAMIGGGIGAAAGFTILCNPNMVDDEPQGRYVTRTPVSYGSESFERRTVRPSRCKIDGEVFEGVSEETCEKMYRAMMSHKSAEITYSTRKEFPAETLTPFAENKVSVPTEGNPCADRGRILLTIKKEGHPRKGDKVCVLPEHKNHPDFQ